MSENVNKHHVVEALNAIHFQGASASQIKIANDFLNQCEGFTQFSTILLSIYCESVDFRLQMSSLLLLTNIIKRGWNSKRSTRNIINNQAKQQLRKNILQAYFMHDLQHYKHFNSLIGYLARLDYPNNYSQLHQFITNSLSQLNSMLQTDMNTVLKSNRVLVVLSTCKTILKQYCHKKIAHNSQSFQEYIIKIIQISLPLSHQLYQQMKKGLQIGDQASFLKLCECLRKIDKVVLYGVGSMPSSYQYNSQIKSILTIFVQRVQQFNSMFDQLANRSLDDVCQQIEKYLIATVEQLSRLQNYFPFLFSHILKEYLFIILKMLVSNTPKVRYYESEKLISEIITANFKPFTSFAYYQTEQDFKNSVYSRQGSDIDNRPIQKQCHIIFKQIYTPEFIQQLLTTLISQIMSAPHVLKGHKQFSDELVLEDIDIAIVEQTDTSAYDNCITLVKNTIKCFKSESMPVIIGMLEKIQVLKSSTDRYSQQVLSNILEVILIIPHIYSPQVLPIDHICLAIITVYDAGKFNYLSRIIRKYHRSLPVVTVQRCFEILAKVVSTPIGGSTTAEIIYQSALGLKTLMSEMEAENIPLQVLAACIQNLVSLVRIRQFTVSPTLLWPIINLIIRLVKCIHDIDKKIVSEAASVIIQGLSPIISSDKNEELIVCALAELISTLLYCSFHCIKEQYPMRGREVTPSQDIQGLNKSSLIVFEGCIMFVNFNIRNKALENYDTIYKFWLTLMRSYPTLYQQQLYSMQLSQTNAQLRQLFKTVSVQLIEEDSIIFIQIVEQHLIAQLIDLTQYQLINIVRSAISEDAQPERKLRVVAAAASLYFSYSLLKAPLMETFYLLFKELQQLQARISPQINCLRTFLFLIINHHILNYPATEIYQLFTQGGDLSWIISFLWNMHFVTNKFAFKLNSAGLFKAISDIGSVNFSKILATSFSGQYPVDEFLKVITIELSPLNLKAMVNSYHNIFNSLLPNQITPDFAASAYRKTRLHLSDEILQKVAVMDLNSQLRVHLSEIVKALDWSSADFEQRVGEKAALELCGYLGWERKIV